jgi:addiction module HigA family antidote
MDDHHESAPVHPGRILLERVMQPLGISRNQLARDIDVPVGRISDITNGKRGITADTAMRLGRYFGVPPQLWLRLQAEYDLHHVKTTTWRDIEARVRVLDGARSVAGLPLAAERPSPPVVAEPTPAPAVQAEPEILEIADSADAIAVPPMPSGDQTPSDR